MAARSLTWILGQTAKWRDGELRQFLHRFKGNSPLPNYICLSPTRRRARFLAKTLREDWRDEKSFEPGVFLIDEFVKVLFSRLPGSQGARRLLSEEACVACVEEALRRRENELEYFTRIRDLIGRPGILKKLTRFIGFLKDNDLEKDFVNHLKLDAYGNAGAKDHDLTLILDAYNHVLQAQGWVDRHDQLDVLAERLDLPHSFFNPDEPSILVLDHLTFLTRLEERFLSRLTRHFVHTVVVLDYDQDPKTLREAIQSPYRHYAQLHSFFTFLLDETEFSPTVIGPQKADATATIRVIKKHNRLEEVREICQRVKELVLSGVSMERIHLVFPKIEIYAPLIYELFPHYGIPFSITRGLPLHSSPLAVVILALLEIPGAYRREDLFRLFSSHLVTFRQPISREGFIEFLDRYEIGERSLVLKREELVMRLDAFLNEAKSKGKINFHFDVQVLDRFARGANIRGGRDLIADWFLPLDRMFSRSRMRDCHQEEEEEKEKRSYFRVLRQLYFLDALFMRFDSLRAAKDSEVFLAHLKQLITFFQIPANVTSKLHDLHDMTAKDRLFLLRRDLGALRKVFEIMERLEDIADLKTQISADGNLPEPPLEMLSRYFKEFVGEEVIQDPIDASFIQITETLEVRGMDFDYCFFGGLTAHEFPRLPEADFILPDTPNARFRCFNPIEESRFLFHHLLWNTTQEIALSYPKVEGRDELEMSSFLEDLLAEQPHRLSVGSRATDLDEYHVFSHMDLEERLASCVRPETNEERRELWFFLDHTRRAKAIRHALAVELSRIDNTQLGPFDGMIDPRWISTHDLGLKPTLSVSQLERFAACPQHYYYAEILGLRPLDEVTDEMEADRFGTYVHEILEIFYRTLIAHGHHAIRQDNFAEALMLMRKAAEEVFSRYAIEPELGENVLWERQRQKIVAGLAEGFDPADQPAGILRNFLEYELANALPDAKVKDLERMFGFTEPFYIGSVPLRGKIDRMDEVVERSPLGEERLAYLIYDYKTGWIAENKALSQGLSFQLPVYCLTQKARQPKAQVGAMVYSLKDATQISRERVILDEGLRDSHLERVLTPRARKFSTTHFQLVTDAVEKIAALRREGRFHYAFTDVICSFCEFRGICRLNRERLKVIGRAKGDLHYIPAQNHHLFLAVERYLQLVSQWEKVITKMREGKRATKKEEEVKAQLAACFGHLPATWQERLRPTYERLMET